MTLRRIQYCFTVVLALIEVFCLHSCGNSSTLPTVPANRLVPAGNVFIAEMVIQPSVNQPIVQFSVTAIPRFIGSATKEYTLDRPHRRTASQEIITVSIAGKQKTMTTNARGDLRINLTKDFHFDTFAQPATLKISLATKSEPIQGDFRINSNDWTTETFVVVADKAGVYASPSSLGKKVGEAKKNDSFQILEKIANWVGVTYKKKKQWIMALSGRTEWRWEGK